MLPDAPTTCPVCGAAMSHDSQRYQALRLTARVFECGGAVCIADGGHLYPALACPKSSAIIAELRAENARLRADNVRIGDRNVLLATELQAIADSAEEQLDDWLPVVIEQLPGYLHFAREVLDLATEALEGEPRPSAAVGVAPGEPAKACPSLSVTTDDT